MSASQAERTTNGQELIQGAALQSTAEIVAQSIGQVIDEKQDYNLENMQRRTGNKAGGCRPLGRQGFVGRRSRHPNNGSVEAVDAAAIRRHVPVRKLSISDIPGEGCYTPYYVCEKRGLDAALTHLRRALNSSGDWVIGFDTEYKPGAKAPAVLQVQLDRIAFVLRHVHL